MKDLKISKELLSEVLETKVKEFAIEKNELRYIKASDSNEIPDLIFINIYELAHKCKEWAMNKGYQIISGLSDEPAYRKQYEKAYAKINYYTEDKIGNRVYKDIYFMANTEVEAVIKASEYVLKVIK